MMALADPQPGAPGLQVHLPRLAVELGFTLIGIAPAEPTEQAGYFRDWLATHKHGEMAYLARNLEMRLDPARWLPGAKSVICVADRHPTSTDDPPRPESSHMAMGRIARYAWGDDYHKVIKKRLYALADSLRARWPEHQYRVAVDTAPILEREYALRAGLGWIGKHTLLIHPKLGSWLLLGEIVTTLPIRTEDAPPEVIPDHCGTCTRCIDACPTGCIEPYKLDASRCLSYLTIEHRGPIEPDLQDAMGDWIAGCDICQQVCPYNRPQDVEATEPPKGYTVRPPAPAVPLLDVLGWDAQARQTALRRSALKRIKLDMFKRNALIAAGNHLKKHPDPAFHQRIEEIANDAGEPELVRATAQQVLQRLGLAKS